MKYLLDTNVISEHRRPKCNPRVKSFMRRTASSDTFLGVVVVGEIVYGINKETDTERKQKLFLWLDALLKVYAGRVISIDLDVISEWGRIRAQYKQTLPFMDSLIAATALVHRLTLVTRNTKDFEGIPGLSLLNPWEFQ
jgi:predicted nucleic acid-binding protein